MDYNEKTREAVIQLHMLGKYSLADHVRSLEENLKLSRERLEAERLHTDRVKQQLERLQNELNSEVWK